MSSVRVVRSKLDFQSDTEESQIQNTALYSNAARRTYSSPIRLNEIRCSPGFITPPELRFYNPTKRVEMEDEINTYKKSSKCPSQTKRKKHSELSTLLNNSNNLTSDSFLYPNVRQPVEYNLKEQSYELSIKELSAVKPLLRKKLVRCFKDNMKLHNIEMKEEEIWNTLIQDKEFSTKTELFSLEDKAFALLSHDSRFKNILIKSFYTTDRSSLVELIQAIQRSKPNYTIYLYTMEECETFQTCSILGAELDSITIGDDFFDDLATSASIIIDRDQVYRALFNSLLL